MQPNQIKNKRILIAPLNWGYGHVARCIALIRELQVNENEVLIAADRAQQKIFSCYFPNITMIDHMGYPFKFSKRGNFSLDLAKGYSKLRRRMEQEKLETELSRKNYNAREISKLLLEFEFSIFTFRIRKWKKISED